VDIVLKPEMAKFFADYTREFGKLADLYFGDPGSLDKYVEMASDPYLRMIKRPRMHEVLKEYNVSLGAPAAVIENVDRLRYDGAYCVLAWQQPYIMGGPLETLLKVITAIKLCERLNATNAAKFVPLLWVHADDHELDEVNRVYVPVGNQIVEEKLEVDETERPSEAVETGDAYDALVDRMRRHLPETPHKEWLLEQLRASKGQNLADHMARLMMRVFGEQGLVIACPRIFRTEISALMGRAIENPERIDRMLTQQKKSLEEKGYPCHTSWEDPLHLYRLSDGHPLRLRYKGDRFVLDGTGGEMTPAQVANEVKRWPQIYTNGVLLSPLEQASCVPAVAFIAGPGGCEFFGVLKALFDDYRVAYPQVMPQVSATIVEKRVEKGLEDLGKTIAQLIEDERAKKAQEGDAPPDHRAALAQLKGDVLSALDAQGKRMDEVAAELARIASEIQQKIELELERLAGAARVGPAREAVHRALDRWESRAVQVSDVVKATLADARRKLMGDLPELHQPVTLPKARQDVANAAKALAEAARAAIEAGVAKVKSELGRTLDEAAGAAIEDAAKNAHLRVSDADWAKLCVAPNGGLQEDTIGVVYFLNSRGPGLYKEVADALDIWDFKHQIVTLE
jgi:bacillithiol biosynthesis cysteine-adding enzyme BshC